ncbi:ribonuclease E inhibitor RraB [Demequina sp.]|uniref:ribonuclease E inhibitor RraB n=1 Tax=Demequina sp. TaxID=2050685 RepID=UPI003A884932
MSNTERFNQEYAGWAPLREQRIELGDNLAAARPVEHFAYFGRKAHAKEAEAALRAAGFEVETARQGFKVALQATRPQSLSDEEVAAFLAEVIGVVEHARGSYDGWGAMTA